MNCEEYVINELETAKEELEISKLRINNLQVKLELLQKYENLLDKLRNHLVIIEGEYYDKLKLLRDPSNTNNGRFISYADEPAYELIIQLFEIGAKINRLNVEVTKDE